MQNPVGVRGPFWYSPSHGAVLERMGPRPVGTGSPQRLQTRPFRAMAERKGVKMRSRTRG